jgi:hypothetical protein
MRKKPNVVPVKKNYIFFGAILAQDPDQSSTGMKTYPCLSRALNKTREKGSESRRYVKTVPQNNNIQ